MSKQNNENSASGSVKTIVVITVKLLLISMITALLLACVNALTKDTIAANIQAEKDAAIKKLFPGEYTSVLYEGDILCGGEVLPDADEIYLIFDGDDKIGYAAQVTPNGFGGELNIMVGINKDRSVAGVSLISHSETPGLGSKAGESAHLDQYKGKTSVILGTDIDKVASATISSKAVNKGVVTALEAYDTVFGESEVSGE